MSYILEALRKAEQQRRMGEVPGIDDVQPVGTPVRRNRIWLWVLPGVLGLGLLAALLWPDAEPARRETDPVSNSKVEMQADNDVLPAPAEYEEPAVTDSPAGETRQQVTDNQAMPPPLRSIPPPRPVPEKMPPGTVVQAETNIEPEPLTVARSEDLSDIPVWPQVSERLLGKLGDGLKLDVHVYAEQPEERFVLINLQKYREGERLSEGPTLEEVTPDGAVMSFEGERFRISAN